MKPWLKLTVPGASRRLRNASLRRKVEAKRWLKKAGGILQREVEQRIANVVIYGTSHPEMML